MAKSMAKNLKIKALASKAAIALGITLGVTLALSPTGTPVTAAEPDSKVERIEELLELTSSSDMGIQVMESMIQQFKISMPTVPDEWWDGFMAKVSPEDMDALIVPIYERNFTDAEIDAMIAFYETPEGQSIIAKMPMVMQESMMSGQVWGESLAEELLRELESDGYDLQTLLPEDSSLGASLGLAMAL